MKRIHPSRIALPTGWQSWVSILLIGFVLYNPFAGLFGSNDGLCYERLARNRATVGASELQHFSPVTNSIVKTELDLDMPATELIEVVQEEYVSTDQKEKHPSRARFATQLSNRPPPAL